MIGRFLKGLPIAAVALALAANAAWAGKANDTLVWTTDREATIADPYYNNTRERDKRPLPPFPTCMTRIRFLRLDREVGQFCQ